MKKFSKITVAAIAIITLFNFSACSKPKNGGEQGIGKQGAGNQTVGTNQTGNGKKSDSSNLTTQPNPEIVKLNAVYAKMSARFKREVVIENPDEFLSDLKSVLEAEKQYASDDLPLYYLIDKTHNVGADYEPKNLVALVKNDDYVINKTTLSLRPDAAKALSVLGRAAQKDGVMLDVSSTYRSYEYQKNLFDYWVSVDGLEEAERERARPGTSQHQLGVAVDFGSIDDNYDKTPGGKWMYAHAAEYGWSLSFPKEYEDITGYRWECWHFRFIGVEACRFQKKWFNDVQQYMLEFIDEWKKS